MLVKKDDRIEIWSDGLNKKFIIFVIIFIIIGILMSIGCLIVKNTPRFVQGLIIVLFLVFVTVMYCLKEKQKYMILTVDSNYITFYSMYSLKNKKIKEIEIKHIENIKIKMIYGRGGGLFLKIYYKEGDIKRIYSFRIGDKETVKVAIQEYIKDLVIEE